jgi:hypothetical protein
MVTSRFLIKYHFVPVDLTMTMTRTVGSTMAMLVKLDELHQNPCCFPVDSKGHTSNDDGVGKELDKARPRGKLNSAPAFCKETERIFLSEHQPRNKVNTFIH